MAKLKDLKVSIGLSSKGITKLNADLRRVKGNFRRNFGEIQGMVRGVGRGMTTALTLPLVGVGAAAVKSAAQLEQLETSFISLTGGAKEAAAMMANLNSFTAKTPFQIENVANAARQLIASGTEVSQVNDQLQFLGDIAATSGVGIEEIAAIFAKVNAKGKVELENLNQLAERGIPIFKALSDATGLPADALGAGAVSVEQFNTTLAQFAKDGGFAAGAMERLSQTAAGKFSTAMDNLKQAGAELVQSLMPTISKLLDFITTLAQRFVGLGDSTKKTILLVAGLLGAAGPVAMAVAALMPIIAALTGPIGLVISAIAALTYVVVKNFSIIEPAIIAVANAVIQFQNKTKALGVIFSIIHNVVSGFFQFTMLGFNMLMDAVSSFATALMEALSGEFGSAGETINSFFERSGNAIIETGVEFGNNLLQGIDDAINADDFKLLEPGSISRFAKNIVSDVSQFFASGGAGAIDVPIRPQMQGMAARTTAVATPSLLMSADAAASTGQAVSALNDKVALSVDLAGEASNAFVGLGDSLAQVAMGTMNFGGMMANILISLADLLGMIGKQFIAAGVAAMNFYANLIANPFAAVAAGVALVATAGVIKALGGKLSAEPPKLAQGGLAYGPTLATVGDNRNASVNPEVIAPLDKLQSMIGGSNVTVTGRLDGRDILISSERAGFDRNRVRGF